MRLDFISPNRTSALVLAAGAVATVMTSSIPAEVPPTAVAVVNGEVITTADLEKRLEGLHGEVEATQRAAANLDRLLFKVVNDVLIGQEARSLGLHEEAPIPEAIERNRRRLALSILEDQEITANSQPRDEEVAAIFEERYRRASFYVLTAADPDGAEQILDALQDGAKLETLAREKSIDPYRDQGGLLENVSRKDLQFTIADVVFRLTPNEVAGPVKTDLGWSVIVLRSFEPPDPLVFDEARPLLERLARQRKQATVRQELLEQLRPRHAVKLNQDLLDSIQPVRRPDGRLKAESPGPESVVAWIGDDITLTGEEYAAALERRWKTIPDEEAARAAAPILLETLVNELLFLAEAYSRGYQEIPAVQRALHGLETEMVIPKFLNSVLASGIEISVEEKHAHYEEVREGLTKPPRVRLGQITVPTQEEAEDMAGALRGGSDLAWLAARHSTDGLRNKGGLQDWRVMRPGDGPVSTTLLESEVGTVLDPLKREESWVVYKLMAREEQGLFSYEEVSGNMREAVLRKKFTEVLDRFIKTVRSRSEIEIREDVLAGLQLSGDREAESEPAGGSEHGGHGGH